MSDFTKRQQHWEQIYLSKAIDEVSWYQPVPQTSLSLIAGLGLDPDAAIIDVGSGESLLVDHLLRAGFNDLSLLDISSKALEKVRQRLGTNGSQVRYHVSDVTGFKPGRNYQLWHDRAVLHFLTDETEVENYVAVLNEAVAQGGYVIIAAFSVDGPTKCSGIEVKQYDEAALDHLLGDEYEMIQSFRSVHQTPFNTSQEFIFGVFRRNQGGDM